MAKLRISIPIPYSRLYAAWTLLDHQFFQAAFTRTGNQLDAFKALLDSKDIDYSHIID